MLEKFVVAFYWWNRSNQIGFSQHMQELSKIEKLGKDKIRQVCENAINEAVSLSSI